MQTRYLDYPIILYLPFFLFFFPFFSERNIAPFKFCYLIAIFFLFSQETVCTETLSPALARALAHGNGICQ